MIRRMIAAIAALQMMSVAAYAAVDCYADVSGAKNVTGTQVGELVTIQADGFQLGIGGGCDLGVGQMLYGVWARYDFTDVSGSVLGATLNQDDYWSLGGRIGFKINEGATAYGLLGFARSDISIVSMEAAREGVLYGAGLEIDLAGFGMPNIVGFVQYEHIDWRDKGAFDSDSDVVRTGVRIKFNVLK